MAGPYAAMLLGDLGADVIKIEPPGAGDQTRSSMGFKMKGSDSLGFLNMNRNKRSIALNLKRPAGKEVFLQLVDTADILIENYRPGVMRKLGLDYQTLAARRPELVYTSISGFGQDGPWSERPGFDLMAQAMSGIMSVTGHPGGVPAKAGVPVADIGCALFAIYAALAAYIGRLKTGRGQLIDASLFDTALAFSIWDISDYWGTGRVPTPVGTSNKMAAPYQAVKALDGYLVIGATNAKLWLSLCTLLGRSDLLADARFATNSDRLANREALIEELERTFATRPAAAWIELLLEEGLPAGPLLSYPEAFQSAHAQHRKMRIDIPHPIEGSVPNIGFAVKLSATPQRVTRHPPLLAEHTEEVLTEIGITQEARAAFERDGAFAT
jgi:crotonobetainyl-CoA:carnitine CoA-transferase CaiB-like acyl-CoA transferase